MKYKAKFTGYVIVDSKDFDGLGEAQKAATEEIIKLVADDYGIADWCEVWEDLHLKIGINDFEEIPNRT